jgi:hypothetical protein
MVASKAVHFGIPFSASVLGVCVLWDVVITTIPPSSMLKPQVQPNWRLFFKGRGDRTKHGVIGRRQ